MFMDISALAGFQGGCIMAASFILLAVAYNLNEAKSRLKERTNVIFCSLGVFIYALTGLVPVFLEAISSIMQVGAKSCPGIT